MLPATSNCLEGDKGDKTAAQPPRLPSLEPAHHSLDLNEADQKSHGGGEFRNINDVKVPETVQPGGNLRNAYLLQGLMAKAKCWIFRAQSHGHRT